MFERIKFFGRGQVRSVRRRRLSKSQIAEVNGTVDLIEFYIALAGKESLSEAGFREAHDRLLTRVRGAIIHLLEEQLHEARNRNSR